MVLRLGCISLIVNLGLEFTIKLFKGGEIVEYYIYTGNKAGTDWRPLKSHDGEVYSFSESVQALMAASVISDLPEYHKRQFKVLDSNGIEIFSSEDIRTWGT